MSAARWPIIILGALVLPPINFGRVQEGKGRKDRHSTLSPRLHELHGVWWLEGGDGA
ncbi:hypothetical protein [Mesorhizobium sp. M1403]|uniref:hypothetical protein n=1 Tax=unclassified Mesorhizobium TaxID=325217 RepID=UPI00333BEE0F